MWPRRVVAGLLLCVLGLTRQARAFDEDTQSTVLAQYRQALAEYQGERYCEAALGFQHALQAIPLPVSALWMARARAKCGDWLAALRDYATATKLISNELWLGNKQQRAQLVAATEAEALERRMPHLIIQVPLLLAANSQVMLDGKLLAPDRYGSKFAVNPGAHLLTLHQGNGIVERQVHVLPVQTLVIRLERTLPANATARELPDENGSLLASRPSSPPPARRFRTATIVAVSFGAAGITAGIVTRAFAFGQQSTIDSHCDTNKACDPTGMEAVHRADSLQTQSTIYLLAGLLGIGTGIGIAIAGKGKPESHAGLTPLVFASGGGLGFERKF
jgi:hypothetical protein